MSNPFGEDDESIEPLPPALLLGPNPFSFGSPDDSPAHHSPSTPTPCDSLQPTPEPEWLRDAATLLGSEGRERRSAGTASPPTTQPLINPFAPERPSVSAEPTSSPARMPLSTLSVAAWMVEPTDDGLPLSTALVPADSGVYENGDAPCNPFAGSPDSDNEPAAIDGEPETEPELEAMLALPAPPAPPLRRAASRVHVDEETYGADLCHGMLALLESGRHADLQFVAGGATLNAHRVLLEARCGRSIVDAIDSGALGPPLPPPHSTANGGEGEPLASRFSLTIGSASSLRVLLRYVYTERFTSVGASLEVIRLCNELDSAGGVPALRRLSQLAQHDLATSLSIDEVVQTTHAAASLRAIPLFRFCLSYMCTNYEKVVPDERDRTSAPAVQALSTAAAAQLFAVRTAAPLQDAIAHGRVDAAQWLLWADAKEWMLDGQPFQPAELLGSRDVAGRTALEAALDCDDMSIATLLLDAGADPSASSASGTGTLLHAVCDKAARAPTEEGSGREGHLSLCYKQAELLLHYGASASAANSSGQAAVDVAVWSGDAKLIRLLLSHGGRSTLSTGEGGSLLHAAAAARRSDVLETALPLLDELGIEIDGPDALGQTALHVAVAAADASLVVPLLRARATLDVTEGGGATALQMAVEARDLRCVSALLQVGANVNVMSGDGVPLLVLAAERSVSVAMSLIQASASVNVVDPTGRSPLDVAVAQGESELAELLLLRGAKPTRNQDTDGNTILHTAVLQQSEQLVSLLVKHKAELSDQNRRGCTPLLLAAESGQPKIAQTLLQAGAGLHLCDAANRSALELALHNNHLETLQVLLEQPNVDINGITLRGSSLLHEAAESGDEHKVNFLLSHGAHVDVLNPNAETPLHWACSLGHVNVVRCLTQHGADALLHERVQGFTPIHAACGPRGQPAVIALLIQRCELMRWNGLPAGCNVLDFARNTPLHTCVRQSPHAAKGIPLLLEHGADPAARNLDGQTVLHLLAERAVRTQQERAGIGESTERPIGAIEAGGGVEDVAPRAPPELPIDRLLPMLSDLPLALDAQETETGNTALHIAAFGGSIEIATFLVGLGASVALPNKDGFTPLDSMQPSGIDGKSIAEVLLSRIDRPPSWVPDRLVSACQLCKLPFILAQPQRNMGNISQQFMARSQSNNVRKHHCRHCGRCVCATCSPRRAPIAKFGSASEERVCLQCEKLLSGVVRADSRRSGSAVAFL